MFLDADRMPSTPGRDEITSRALPRGREVGPPSIPARHVRPRDNFDHLVGLYRDGERIQADLRRLRARIVRAAAYQADPSCHPGLARAHLEHLRDRRSADLAALRAHRIEAGRLLVGRSPSGTQRLTGGLGNPC